MLTDKIDMLTVLLELVSPCATIIAQKVKSLHGIGITFRQFHLKHKVQYEVLHVVAVQ